MPTSTAKHAYRNLLQSDQTADVRAQIKLWLSTIDALLVAIEQTAFEVRGIGESAMALVNSVRSGGATEGPLSSAHKMKRELSQWPARLSRLTQTGLVLARVATSYRLHNTKAAFISRSRAARSREELHEDSARRLYELSIRHGGAFLKLGQMLSSRPDLLPAAYVRELSKLQDAAPAVPYAAVVQVLERELGQRMADVFAEFEEAPVAAASIGQVHRATLRDGRKVAVKVQRPNIDELVSLDMELLEVFVRALAESLPPLDFDTIIRETRAMVSAELDYEREAELTAQASVFFAGNERIAVPAVVRELSTRRVLTTIFMPGEKITHVLDRLVDARAAGEANAQSQLSAVLASVFEAYARQVLELGLFQADPHPGNLLADDQGKVTVLDFGCAKQLDDTQRSNQIALLRALMVRDTQAMGAAMEQMGFRTRSNSRAGLEALAAAALSQMALVKSEGGGFASQMQMVSGIAEFGRFVSSDPIVRLPDEFVMLGRVFGTLSGLFVHYRPDVTATARVLPIVFAALMARPTVSVPAAASVALPDDVRAA